MYFKMNRKKIKEKNHIDKNETDIYEIITHINDDLSFMDTCLVRITTTTKTHKKSHIAHLNRIEMFKGI